MSGRRIIIIAGPNGAGKTTFATQFLPHEADCIHFVNADMIAAGLSPFKPEAVSIKAGRLMLEQIQTYIRREISFAFETTLSGRGYARMIPGWRQSGYQVFLFFSASPPLLSQSPESGKESVKAVTGYRMRSSDEGFKRDC